MTSESQRAVQAGSFGQAAGVYERGRPSYPAAAIDGLLPSTARRVLDLGAGTGKLTRGLLGRGLEVIAVEPSAGMRAELSRVLPEVTVLDGSAEHIPLPDRAVDAVVCGQAWHWVDPARAVPEAARVLTPGGQLGLAWNIRDERVGWVKALTGVLASAASPASLSAEISLDPPVGPPFGPVQRFDVPWSLAITQAGLLDLVASRSYVITLDDPARTALLHQVQQLIDTGLAGAAEFPLPYVCRCSVATLTAAKLTAG